MRQLFEFTDAELVIAGGGQVLLRLLRGLTPSLPAGSEVNAVYALGDGLVRSLAYQRADRNDIY